MIARTRNPAETLAWRARFVILALTAALVWACAPYLAGLLGAAVLAVVCAPAYRRLRGTLGGRGAALALTVAAAALALLLVGVIVASNIDNVLLPVVYRHVSGLHPMATLVGAFSGIEFLGLPGLLLGPLAIAYALELIHLYEEEYGDPSTGDDLVARAGRDAEQRVERAEAG